MATNMSGMYTKGIYTCAVYTSGYLMKNGKCYQKMYKFSGTVSHDVILYFQEE